MRTWRVQLYPHTGRFLVSNDYLEAFGACSLASFTTAEDAQRFADARNEWENTRPDPGDFGGNHPYVHGDGERSGTTGDVSSPPDSSSELGGEVALLRARLQRLNDASTTVWHQASVGNGQPTLDALNELMEANAGARAALAAVGDSA